MRVEECENRPLGFPLLSCLYLLASASSFCSPTWKQQKATSFIKNLPFLHSYCRCGGSPSSYPTSALSKLVPGYCGPAGPRWEPCPCSPGGNMKTFSEVFLLATFYSGCVSWFEHTSDPNTPRWEWLWFPARIPNRSSCRKQTALISTEQDPQIKVQQLTSHQSCREMNLWWRREFPLSGSLIPRGKPTHHFGFRAFKNGEKLTADRIPLFNLTGTNTRECCTKMNTWIKYKHLNVSQKGKLTRLQVSVSERFWK